MLNFHQTCIKLNICHFNSLLSISLVTAYQNIVITSYTVADPGGEGSTCHPH